MHKHFLSLLLLLHLCSSSYAQTTKAELFVLAVGVSKYELSRLNLNYADKDASDLANAWNAQTGMYKVVEVKTLTNQQATRQAVREALDYFKGQITSNDLFVFIFSGHGMNEYLVPYNFNPADIDATALSKNDLTTKMKALGCNYIMLLDACHSGSFAKDVAGKDVDPGAFSLNVEQAAQLLVNELSSTDKTNIVIGSSSSDQRSFECDACQNGYFAQAILDCFEGKTATGNGRTFRPDANSNGFVSMHEFDEYVKEVVRITTLNQGSQTVRSKYSMGTDVPMIRPTNAAAPAQPARPAPVFTDADPDGDGFKGSADECANVHGTVRGCPDGDEDGIIDSEDSCPYDKGSADRQGCPPPKDSDSDGIPDTGDPCPYDKGEKRFSGCPDSDSDNVPDNKDNCPREKGTTNNNGCPEKVVAVKPSGNTDLPNDMIFMQGGTFSMGTGSDAHSKKVASYYLANHELTFAEYDAFCEATGRTKPSDQSWGRNQRPAINVSWLDAVAYCNWRSTQERLSPCYTINGENVSCDFSKKGYRLPSEAEWEYAARSGGGSQKYAGTDSESSLYLYANFCDVNCAYSPTESGKKQNDGYAQTAPVKQFRTNEKGLYDMSGNVWEWCWDWYGDYSSSAIYGASSGSSRVLRGGSWYYGSPYCASAYRNSDSPANSSYSIGFRLSRTE